MRILACTLALLATTAVQAADVYAPAPGYSEAPPPAYGPPPPAYGPPPPPVVYPGPPPPAPRAGYFVPHPPYGPPPVIAYGAQGVPPYVYRDARAYPYPDFRQSWTCWWEWGERRCGLLSHW
jgi:hypothetical protein